LVYGVEEYAANDVFAEDGKEMAIDLETMKIKDVMEQVDRHSRMLARKEDLNG